MIQIVFFKTGAPIAFYDNCGEIAEGSFLCSSSKFDQEEMGPFEIIRKNFRSDHN